MGASSKEMAEELLIKTIIVGDGAIGKTCLMNAVKRPAEEMQDDYEATVADNEVVDWQFENETWQVDLWDTAGQENFSKLRLSAYPGSNVIMVAFDMTAPESLNNIVDADKGWVAEIKSKVKSAATPHSTSRTSLPHLPLHLAASPSILLYLTATSLASHYALM